MTWLERPLTRRNFLKAAGFAAAAAAAGCAARPLDLAAIAGRAGAGKKPVVVIGAGLGGLTAAAYLAKAGYPVTVVEQHSKPGGYATSFDRAAGRFTFEVSLHQTAAQSGASRLIFHELGLEDKVEPVKLKNLAHILTPDNDLTLPPADVEGCVQALAAKFPQEEAGFRSLFNEMVETAEDVAALPDRLSAWDYVTFPRKHKLLWKIRNETLADALARHVKDPRARALSSFLWGYYGLPPSRLSAFYYYIATGQYLQGGGYCYRPRSQALSQALVDLIEAHGGRVLLETEVREIIIADRAVAGARLAGWEAIPAKAVISNAGGPDTFFKMLPPEILPAAFRKQLEQYRPSISSFVVWLGLNREIQHEFKEYGTFVQDGPLARDPEAEYQACLSADAARVGYAVNIFDNAFPGYSKPGTSTMSIMFVCGYEPFRRFETDYFSGRKAEYLQEKERLAGILIERTEKRFIPGLSGMIEVMEIGTPLTNRWYTRNPEGAIYGYEQSVGNTFTNRIKNRTPIKGLYLAGAWGAPGGGFTGVQGGGRGAFLDLMEDWS
ncbi:MAG: NAD(P)/FAD-dependent oxidoreductase [Pseudomonadota bacterium]